VKRLAAWVVALPPRRQDLALALALAAYYVGSLIPEIGQLRLPYLAFVLVALEALPLTWRRRWPVIVWLAVGVPRVIYDDLSIQFAPQPLASMIAFYTVMDRGSARARWVIGGLTLVGVINTRFLPGHTPYNAFVSGLELAAAGMAGIISRTRRAYLQEVETRAEHAEAERDREVALAAAQERARIARELHDVVAHHVSLMAVQSEAAASLLPDRPAEAARSVEIIGRTARDALAELRRLLGVLRGPAVRAGPSMSPSPSISELDRVLAQVRQAGIAVNLRVEGSPGKLTPGVDLTAFRIVQEALTNTVRHSGAGEAAVTVRYEPGYVTVSVTDTGNGPGGTRPVMPRNASNGDGLRQAAPGGFGVGGFGGLGVGGFGGFGVAAPGGFGLAGIAERVASCGGSLTVGPCEAGGFAVTARLPVS
jgi:signal transduction histidine kinase